MTNGNSQTELLHLKAGLKAFFRIAEEWDLSCDQCLTLLGNPSRTLYSEWKSGDVKVSDVSNNLLDRLSYILGIYKDLKIIHTAENQKLFLTNSTHVAPFNNKSPLEYMLSGHYEALVDVRYYLDQRRLGE